MNNIYFVLKKERAIAGRRVPAREREAESVRKSHPKYTRTAHKNGGTKYGFEWASGTAAVGCGGGRWRGLLRVRIIRLARLGTGEKKKKNVYRSSFYKTISCSSAARWSRSSDLRGRRMTLKFYVIYRHNTLCTSVRVRVPRSPLSDAQLFRERPIRVRFSVFNWKLVRETKTTEYSENVKNIMSLYDAELVVLLWTLSLI